MARIEYIIFNSDKNELEVLKETGTFGVTIPSIVALAFKFTKMQGKICAARFIQKDRTDSDTCFIPSSQKSRNYGLFSNASAEYFQLPYSLLSDALKNISFEVTKQTLYTKELSYELPFVLKYKNISIFLKGLIDENGNFFEDVNSKLLWTLPLYLENVSDEARYNMFLEIKEILAKDFSEFSEMQKSRGIKPITEKQALKLVNEMEGN